MPASVHLLSMEYISGPPKQREQKKANDNKNRCESSGSNHLNRLCMRCDRLLHRHIVGNSEIVILTEFQLTSSFHHILLNVWPIRWFVETIYLLTV